MNKILGIDEFEFIKALDYLHDISYGLNEPKALLAYVKGTANAPYRVSLSKNDKYQQIRGECSCPAFDRYEQCKHIAAVLIKETGSFFDGNLSHYEFVPAFLHDNEKDIEFGASKPFTPSFIDLHAHFVPYADEPNLQSSKIKNFYSSTQALSNQPYHIWYYLDLNSYDGDDQLVRFHLECQSLLKSGKLGKRKEINITNELITHLMNPEDKKILQQLCAFAHWEYHYTKRVSRFHRGSFLLKDNKDLLLSILKTHRAVKQDYYSYYHQDDELLQLSEKNLISLVEINSLNKRVEILFQEKETEKKILSFEPVHYFSHLDLILVDNVFYPISSYDCIPNSIQHFIQQIQEHDLELDNNDWEVLKKTLVREVPNHLISGDKFELKTVTKELLYQVYLKWEENSQFIRGTVLNLKYDELDVLTVYTRHSYLKLLDFFKMNQIDIEPVEESFLFPIDFLHTLCHFLEEQGVEVFFKKHKLQTAKEFKLNSSSGINWLELNPQIKFDELDINFAQTLKQLDLSNNTIKLGNGDIGIIPPKWIKQIHILQAHAKKEKDSLRLHPAKLLLLDDSLSHELPKSMIDLKANLENFGQIEAQAAPKNFKGQLRAYQEFTLGWLDFLERCQFGGCLADDMGLGKTVQIISHIARKFLNNKKLKVLIVAPKSLTGNWQSEFQNFCPSIKTYRWDTKDLAQKEYDHNQVIIVSYQLLQRQKRFDYEFDHLILDEAQAIKNPQALTHLAVSAVKARQKIALTGTPVENHAGDLMSIFNVVMPGLFQLKNIKDPSSLTHFDFIRPFLLRRTKNEVLKDLPEKTVQTIYCEQGKVEKRHYLSIHATLKNELKSQEFSQNKFNFLQVLTKLRQAACHINLVSNVEQVTSSKLETLKELVADIHQNNQKVIIFSQFTRLLKIAQKELQMDASNSCYLDGKTQKREQQIDLFKSSREHSTFFISIKAGGVGLNLTNANYCIILDPWWNPSVESQAIDRIHRIGQKNPVFAYRLITKDTIEQKVSLIQDNKKKLYEKILSNTEGFIKDLNKSDMEFLLGTDF